MPGHIREPDAEAYDDWDNETCYSSESAESLDEDEVNTRVAPTWYAYRQIIEKNGFRLDTCRDVKLWYQQYWESMTSRGIAVSRDCPGYARACVLGDDDLCKDAGLPENLFRGTQCSDGTKVIIKAVHLHSREYDIMKYLNRPCLRSDPRNHLIPILDMIEVPKDDIVFLVMEELSPQLMPLVPCPPRLFLGALRQWIEHVVFMHSHHIAHLDISSRNLVVDHNYRYAYIDFELSRRFEGIDNPRVHIRRGTEIAPELERGEAGDPYKADVWSLGMLMVNASTTAGYSIPELNPLIGAMLNMDPDHRPNATMVLKHFDTVLQRLGEATRTTRS